MYLSQSYLNSTSPYGYECTRLKLDHLELTVRKYSWGTIVISFNKAGLKRHVKPVSQALGGRWNTRYRSYNFYSGQYRNVIDRLIKLGATRITSESTREPHWDRH